MGGTLWGEGDGKIPASSGWRVCHHLGTPCLVLIRTTIMDYCNSIDSVENLKNATYSRFSKISNFYITSPTPEHETPPPMALPPRCEFYLAPGCSSEPLTAPHDYLALFGDAPAPSPSSCPPEPSSAAPLPPGAPTRRDIHWM